MFVYDGSGAMIVLGAFAECTLRTGEILVKKVWILGFCLLPIIVSGCGVNAAPTRINNTIQLVSTQGSGINQNGSRTTLTPSPIP